MKTLARRFALIAVLGSLLCGALVAGCGGGDADDAGTGTNGAATS
jgi:hypothetical protein